MFLLPYIPRFGHSGNNCSDIFHTSQESGNVENSRNSGQGPGVGEVGSMCTVAHRSCTVCSPVTVVHIPASLVQQASLWRVSCTLTTESREGTVTHRHTHGSRRDCYSPSHLREQEGLLFTVTHTERHPGGIDHRYTHREAPWWVLRTLTTPRGTLVSIAHSNHTERHPGGYNPSLTHRKAPWWVYPTLNTPRGTLVGIVQYATHREAPWWV